MKCFAFVDLHGSKKAYDAIASRIKKERPDFLICAGDFTIFEHEVDKLLVKLSRLDGRLFYIHGNHEEEGLLRKLGNRYKNMEFIHGKIVKFKDIVLVGWGGGGFTIRDREFEDWVKTKKKELKEYKKEGKKLIFVGHAPFYRTRLDKLGKEHHGNKSFTHFLKEFRVDIGICGHFHENAGKEDKIKGIRLYNPGAKGITIEI